MDIAGSVCAAPATGDGGETNEGGSLFALAAEERSRGDVGPIFIGGEDTMGT